MTTEAAFAAALDADPTDWQTRLVFADWLLDRGDMRWEGMRWLGMERKWPVFLSQDAWYTVIGWNWVQVANRDQPEHSIIGLTKYELEDSDLWRAFKTRADAEDAFCRAYPALAAAHPAEFAVGVMA